VRARWQAKGRGGSSAMYGAVVTAVNADGTYKLQYDDNDVDDVSMRVCVCASVSVRLDVDVLTCVCEWMCV
jgi:mevalonate pyrophosphate decarboxylase